jgi:thiol-disulfide isomerase/thioredoxin
MSRAFLPLSLAFLFLLAAALLWRQFAGTQKAEAVFEGQSAEAMFGPFRIIEPPRPLPEFHFVDSSGVKRTLADFSGKTVLLNIWATWCPPCRREMPSLGRLHFRMGSDDFQVLAISTDLNGISVVQEFYRKVGISALEAYIDQDSETENALKVPGLPTTLLIDKKGNAVAVKVGPAEWDSDEVVAVVNAQISTSAGLKKQ